jgi:hypothetical protein
LVKGNGVVERGISCVWEEEFGAMIVADTKALTGRVGKRAKKEGRQGRDL